MSSDTAIVKFNNSRLALLCSNCRVIIKTGIDFTKEELDLVLGSDKNRLPAQYCEQCKTKQDEGTNT